MLPHKIPQTLSLPAATPDLDLGVSDGEFGVRERGSGRHPLMLEDLCRSVALHGVHVEHPQHQVLGRRGDGVPIAAGERDLSLPDPRQDVFWRVLWTSCKWSGSAINERGTNIIPAP